MEVYRETAWHDDVNYKKEKKTYTKHWERYLLPIGPFRGDLETAPGNVLLSTTDIRDIYTHVHMGVRKCENTTSWGTSDSWPIAVAAGYYGRTSRQSERDSCKPILSQYRYKTIENRCAPSRRRGARTSWALQSNGQDRLCTRARMQHMCPLIKLSAWVFASVRRREKSRVYTNSFTLHLV